MSSPRRAENFYPRPPRGGRREAVGLALVGHAISIHALREEGDAVAAGDLLGQLQFLSTPSARRATSATGGSESDVLFLSTPSARRATQAGQPRQDPDHFYPRPPRGGRRPTPTPWPPWPPISIHALREEGDADIVGIVWGIAISIHALREEGDSKNRDKISIFKQIIQHSARI